MPTELWDYVVTGIGAVLGWFVRVLWEADKELRIDIAKLREELPKDYVTKDDYKSDVKEIKEMLRDLYRMFDKRPPQQ